MEDCAAAFRWLQTQVSCRVPGPRPGLHYEVRELDSGRRFVMATAQGPFPMETTYTWEDAGASGTRMTLRNRGEPSGLFALAARVVAHAMRRANEADLRRLKAILER